MDKKQLITIAVTAVVSVIAKEFFTWLFGSFKSFSMSKTVRERTRKAFSKSNRAIIKDSFLILFSVVSLVIYFRNPAAPTRGEIFFLILNMINLFFWAAVLMWDIVTWKDESKEQQKENQPPPP